MKLAYHKDTDSLYIELLEAPSVESREVAEGIVLDYDAAGNLVGIDIDNASRKVELRRVELSGLEALGRSAGYGRRGAGHSTGTGGPSSVPAGPRSG